MDCDILVIGGGISGSIAAISAARLGANVLLVEKNGYLGGTLTGCGTGPMMTFHAGERQVVKGITGEVIDRLHKKGKSPGHLFDTTCYTYTVTPFDSEAMKKELEETLIEAGGRILYHSFVCGVDVNDNKIKDITICSKSGLSKISAKVFIDASGDADISRFAGFKTHLGRQSDNKCQPLTLNMKLYNVDTTKAKEYIKNNPEDFPRMDVSKLEMANRLSVGGYNTTFKAAIKDGEISFDREFLLYFETNNEGEVIVNTTRISNINPLLPDELTNAEIEGRKQCEEVYNFLRKRIPGFSDCRIAYTGPNIGVRGSVQIDGLYTITEDDILSCRKFEDTIAHGAYPIDVHPPEGADDSMFDTPKLKNGDFYSIPLKSMMSNAENLLTVGRCISATFEAQAAIRVSPIAGAIGHGGGVAAFVALKDNKNVQDIDTKKVQEILRNQSAFID